MIFYVDESTKPIINSIMASRYDANMETFGFVPNERGRHPFHLKLICFWIDVFIGYSLEDLNKYICILNL